MQGDQRPTILGLSIAFPILSIIAVLLRFKAREVNRANLGADDWTIAVALVGHPTSSLCIIVVLTDTLAAAYNRRHYCCASW